MNEDEMIKELAQPIIEKLKEVESEIGDREFAEIPQIRLVRQPMAEPMVVDGFEITDEFLEKLEEYVQDELEIMHKPSILH